MKYYTKGKLAVDEFNENRPDHHFQITGTGDYECEEVARTPEATERDKNNAIRLAKVNCLFDLAESYKIDCQARINSLTNEWTDLEYVDSEEKHALWDSEYWPQVEHWLAIIKQINIVLE